MSSYKMNGTEDQMCSAVITVIKALLEIFWKVKRSHHKNEGNYVKWWVC